MTGVAPDGRGRDHVWHTHQGKLSREGVLFSSLGVAWQNILKKGLGKDPIDLPSQPHKVGVRGPL